MIKQFLFVLLCLFTLSVIALPKIDSTNKVLGNCWHLSLSSDFTTDGNFWGGFDIGRTFGSHPDKPLFLKTSSWGVGFVHNYTTSDYFIRSFYEYDLWFGLLIPLGFRLECLVGNIKNTTQAYFKPSIGGSCVYGSVFFNYAIPLQNTPNYMEYGLTCKINLYYPGWRHWYLDTSY